MQHRNNSSTSSNNTITKAVARGRRGPGARARDPGGAGGAGVCADARAREQPVPVPGGERGLGRERAEDHGTGNANPIGLDPTLTASYFGKIQRTGTGRAYRDADIAKSLLHMVSDNVAEIGWLLSRVHRTELVVFCGGFLLDNHCVWQLITKSIRYWSHGSRRALFLAHDGYLGALGALLTEKPPQ